MVREKSMPSLLPFPSRSIWTSQALAAVEKKLLPHFSRRSSTAMVTRRNYRDDTVAAARSVMIELVHLLGEYRESLVLIGGWLPELLLPNRDKPHVGNIDVDLALDHRTIQAEGYRTIQELLLSRGYL